jgi:hypothetical protein
LSQLVSTHRLGYKNQSPLCREIIAVYSEINTKYIKTLRKQNVEILNVKTAGTHKSKDWALKGHCTKAEESVVWFGGQKM